MSGMLCLPRGFRDHSTTCGTHGCTTHFTQVDIADVLQYSVHVAPGVDLALISTAVMVLDAAKNEPKGKTPAAL